MEQQKRAEQFPKTPIHGLRRDGLCGCRGCSRLFSLFLQLEGLLVGRCTCNDNIEQINVLASSTCQKGSEKMTEMNVTTEELNFITFLVICTMCNGNHCHNAVQKRHLLLCLSILQPAHERILSARQEYICSQITERRRHHPTNKAEREPTNKVGKNVAWVPDFAARRSRCSLEALCVAIPLLQGSLLCMSQTKRHQ